jgi:hypothetical protein
LPSLVAFLNTNSIDEWVGPGIDLITRSPLPPIFSHRYQLQTQLSGSSSSSLPLRVLLPIFSLPWWLMESCGGPRPAGISPLRARRALAAHCLHPIHYKMRQDSESSLCLPTTQLLFLFFFLSFASSPTQANSQTP